MRRLLRLTLLLLTLPIFSSAADIYWKGSAPGLNNWNALANWFTDAAGTIPSAALPGPTDVAIFSNLGNGGVVTFSGPVTVQKIQINAAAPVFTFIASQPITLNGAADGFGFTLLSPSTFLVSNNFICLANFRQTRGSFLMGGGPGFTHYIRGNFTVDGPPSITPSFILSATNVMEIGGNFTLLDPTAFAADDNTEVIFRKTFTANASIRVDNTATTVATFYNVTFDEGTVSGQNVVSFFTNTIIEVRNNLTLTSGRFLGNATRGLRVLGNVTSAGNLVGQSTALLEFSGPNNQTVSFNGSDFDKWNGPVTINKAVASTGVVTLGTPLRLDGNTQNLTFTNGIIVSSATNLLTLGASAIATGFSNNSFVDGPVAKVGASAFTFPIGDAGVVAPIITSGLGGATSPLGASATYIAEYFRADPTTAGFNSSSVTPPLTNASKCEYWTVNKTTVAAASNARVWLSYDNIRSCGVTDPSQLRVANWPVPGTAWVDRGTGLFTSTPFSFVGTTGLQTSYPNFTLASLNPILNPLPVKWLSFTGRKVNGAVELNWSTTAELNNESYTVQRSANGKDFANIGSVPGKGTTNLTSYYDFTDKTPLSGTSYYRIKQTDLDGKFSYSDIIRISPADLAAGLRLYPNPVTNSRILNLENANWRNQKVKVTVYNSIGSIVHQEQVSFGADSRAKLNLSGLMNGSYFISSETGAERKVVPFVIQ